MHHHRPPLAVHLTENTPCVHLNSHPVSVNSQHTATGSGSRNDANVAWRTLVDNTTTASLTPCITDASDTKTFYSAFQVTDIHPDSSDEDDYISTTGMAAGSTSNGASTTEDKPAKPKKSPSRASSTSQRGPRSASSSTAGTRKERRRTASFQAQSPASPPRSNSIQMSQQKRDELLALHRDSCRLFQDLGMAVEPLESSYDESRLTQSSTASPTMSPVLQSQRSHSFPINDGDISEDDLLSVRQLRRISVVHSEPDPEREPTKPPSHEQVPATVIDWTSPSTRRREYEAIDRSNRGFRRVWRRMTPRCFRPSETRTPFFETGKDGKANYEGSVRRFRMDITDEKETNPPNNGLVSRPKPVKRTWSCF